MQARCRHARPTSGEALRNKRALALAQTYRKRGKLTPQPCEVCGAADVVMHQPDPSRPLSVRWRCRPHHAALREARRADLLSRKRRGLTR